MKRPHLEWPRGAMDLARCRAVQLAAAAVYTDRRVGLAAEPRSARSSCALVAQAPDLAAANVHRRDRLGGLLHEYSLVA